MRKHIGTCLEQSQVLDSRPRNGYVYRKRRCLKCGIAFVTNEITADELQRLQRLEQFQAKLQQFALELSGTFQSEPRAIATGSQL